MHGGIGIRGTPTFMTPGSDMVTVTAGVDIMDGTILGDMAIMVGAHLIIMEDGILTVTAGDLIIPTEGPLDIPEQQIIGQMAVFSIIGT